MTIFSALAACTLITFESLGASLAFAYIDYWHSFSAEWVRSSLSNLLGLFYPVHMSNLSGLAAVGFLHHN